jgi:aquaporin Z
VNGRGTVARPTEAAAAGPASGTEGAAGALAALRRHWPEYLAEAGGLGLFLLSACVLAALLEHPGSPVRQTVGSALLRRIPMGVAMGLTAVALIYAPWGQRSGAHLNPAVTLTFWRLGTVAPWDAAFYVAAHFTGALAGVGVAAGLLGAALADPAVAYAATVPGAAGAGVAFAAEAVLSFVLMTVVLAVSNRPALNRFTGLCAGALVAAYIVLEALGDEPEPRPDAGLGVPRPGVDGALGLRHGTPARHAGRRPAVPRDAGAVGGAVREAPPRQPPAVHLPVPLRGARPVIGRGRRGDGDDPGGLARSRTSPGPSGAGAVDAGRSPHRRSTARPLARAAWPAGCGGSCEGGRGRRPAPLGGRAAGACPVSPARAGRSGEDARALAGWSGVAAAAQPPAAA